MFSTTHTSGLDVKKKNNCFMIVLFMFVYVLVWYIRFVVC